ncbi:hypothetical protein C0585_07065 [Candidatus Woesearchaeota archaeon]|nr:MAG: hypothetical protein C0585_07065 [Candidatus Woesearchaeota archaeon]
MGVSYYSNNSLSGVIKNKNKKMVLNNLLDPVFAPILSLPPFWGILIISFLVTLLITIIYKLVTDQEVMKTLKADMKAMQKEMKKLKDNPKKMMEVQKKAMEKNMQYMMASMKPTLFTLIPILIIFGWLSGHLAYHPLAPNDPFELVADFDKGSIGEAKLIVPEGIKILNDATQIVEDEQITWVLEGELGDYNAQIEYNNKVFDKRILISEEVGQYAEVKTKISSANLEMITLSNEKIIGMNLFGWKVGWLGTYIIFSIIFSTSLRKILKLH